MKYVIIIPDGAADEPIEQFGGKTVFEAADIPNIDKISRTGRLGLVQTVPDKMPPGSDVAMMSLLGYNPQRYYTGRAPLEAVAMNIQLEPTDWVFRCNLVTIADDKMADHSAGHISSAEGAKIIEDLNNAIGSKTVKFYPGVSYRHLCVIKGVEFDVYTEPPHDIIGQLVEKNLPRGKNCELLTELMAKSRQLLAEHEINRIRRDLGENTVSSIWLWGQGKKASMDSFQSRFGLKGTAITAVDLVRGISKLIGFDLIKVEGATGFADTNYNGKAQAAIDALEKYDIVFVHIEGPDEAGHAGNAELKKKAVERIDKYVVGPVYNALQKYDGWRILIMPDHPTPCKGQAHTGAPVPFTIAGTGVSPLLDSPFSEANAAQSGLKIEKGFELMEYFIKS
ncbi:MAG: cofactor-independent phosphoglycerate mutase [Planctomycetes bacterium GWF2_41_51]|nr:MAG: cofactor-independent phosphoglycerate mutase [Planctomycetes bacterium GWF2_41_51]HBG25777.1 cofactor-independent phosphoglycerate mutase [Phycisphaerales bacterium]